MSLDTLRVGRYNVCMIESKKLPAKIFQIVREYGELVGRAGSRWGRDEYHLEGITAALEDEGYTYFIKSEGIELRDTMQGITYSKGGDSQLRELWKKVVSIT